MPPGGPYRPAAAAPLPPGPTGNVPGRWRLVFSAVFTGQALSTAGWSKGWLAPGITPPQDRQELECYAPVPADMRVAYVRVWQHPGR